MFRKIKIIPLASESLGVRSMCTYVETPDLRVLLDGGAALCPKRFGFLPHPREYEAMEACRENILKAAEKADVVTLSHYHFDHHTPSFEDWCFLWSSEEFAKRIYEGKIVLIKNHRSMINFNQRRRGWLFIKKTGRKCAKKIEMADGNVFKFGDTKLKFSDAVFHGSKDTTLGWVLMTTIEVGCDKILFAPDVQGPMYNPTLRTIIAEKPKLIIIGGPPLYLTGLRVKEEYIQEGMKNLEEIVKKIPVTILDHHILREERWRKMFNPLYNAASKSHHKVVTAAEFMGKKNNLLEFRRKQLYNREPPNTKFQKWMRLPLSKRKRIKPPKLS
jgi:predicted metallo-beta-lactamase superfamily hydrolase